MFLLHIKNIFLVFFWIVEKGLTEAGSLTEVWRACTLRCLPPPGDQSVLSPKTKQTQKQPFLQV